MAENVTQDQINAFIVWGALMGGAHQIGEKMGKAIRERQEEIVMKMMTGEPTPTTAPVTAVKFQPGDVVELVKAPAHPHYALIGIVPGIRGTVEKVGVEGLSGVVVVTWPALGSNLFSFGVDDLRLVYRKSGPQSGRELHERWPKSHVQPAADAAATIERFASSGGKVLKEGMDPPPMSKAALPFLKKATTAWLTPLEDIVRLASQPAGSSVPRVATKKPLKKPEPAWVPKVGMEVVLREAIPNYGAGAVGTVEKVWDERTAVCYCEVRFDPHDDHRYIFQRDIKPVLKVPSKKPSKAKQPSRRKEDRKTKPQPQRRFREGDRIQLDTRFGHVGAGSVGVVDSVIPDQQRMNVYFDDYEGLWGVSIHSAHKIAGVPKKKSKPKRTLKKSDIKHLRQLGG